MMRRLTEDEAFAAARGTAAEDSYFAQSLRADTAAEFFGKGMVTIEDDDAAAVAACVYFAVRGGAVVMREETAAEHGERMRSQAGAVHG